VLAVALALLSAYSLTQGDSEIPTSTVASALVGNAEPGTLRIVTQWRLPRTLLAVLQLFRAARPILYRYRIQEGAKVGEREVTLPSGSTKIQEIFNDTVIGYDRSGHEVVRTTVQEPTFERPRQHLNSI